MLFYFISKADRNEEGTDCTEVFGHMKSCPGTATLLSEAVTVAWCPQTLNASLETLNLEWAQGCHGGHGHFVVHSVPLCVTPEKRLAL